jgi:type IV secretion system protein VirB5
MDRTLSAGCPNFSTIHIDPQESDGMSPIIRLRLTAGVLAFCGTALLLSAPARAQFAVIDVASVAQLIQQAQTLSSQLAQARAQVAQAQALYQSLTGNRGMQLLLSGTVRNYLPTNWPSLIAAAMQGSGSSAYGALSGDIQTALRVNAVLTGSQLAALPPAQQAQITATRSNVALMQGLTQEALVNSSGRFSAIQQLIQAIPTATDQKAILELQARIGAEQGMLQNEQTKLQTLYQSSLAQAALLQLQGREQSIAAQGSFATRFEPTP